jgi:aspartate ammonia-lyase
VAFEVIGNDLMITMASEAAQLQLNAFEPIMGWALYKSAKHLANACKLFRSTVSKASRPTTGCCPNG